MPQQARNSSAFPKGEISTDESLDTTDPSSDTSPDPGDEGSDPLDSSENDTSLSPHLFRLEGYGDTRTVQVTGTPAHASRYLWNDHSTHPLLPPSQFQFDTFFVPESASQPQGPDTQLFSEVTDGLPDNLGSGKDWLLASLDELSSLTDGDYQEEADLHSTNEQHNFCESVEQQGLHGISVHLLDQNEGVCPLNTPNSATPRFQPMLQPSLPAKDLNGVFRPATQAQHHPQSHEHINPEITNVKPFFDTFRKTADVQASLHKATKKRCVISELETNS